MQSEIEIYYKNNKEKWRKNAQNETLKYLSQGLIDRAVTRDLEWGIDIPIIGYEKKRMYVWIDAVLGYITATMKYCEEHNLDWKKYWKGNEETIIYMVHGKDNIIFHSIILPALLISMQENMKLPDKMVSCEYLNINNEKISKSKGNGITILDLTEKYDIDSIRYYFLSNGPEKKDTNFGTEEFKNVHNSDLVNKYGNFINRTLNFKGLEEIKPGKIEKEIDEKISKTYNEVSKYLENLEFRKAIEEIIDLVEFGNKYYDDEKPWILFKEDINKFNNIIYNCATIIANLANLFEPIMPISSEKIKNYLNINESGWEKIVIKEKIQLKNITPLFERLK